MRREKETENGVDQQVKRSMERPEKKFNKQYRKEGSGKIINTNWKEHNRKTNR